MTEQNSIQIPETQEPQSGGRKVDAGQGIEWLKEGWQLFLRNPGVWIAISVIALIIFVVLGFIPLLGQLAANLLAPVFGAGLLVGCRALAQGEELKIEHLFAGFQQQTGNLVLLGVLAVVANVVIFIVSFAIFGGSAATGTIVGHAAGASMALGGFLLAVLVGLALTIPLAMALWFAPALVVFRNQPPIEAAKTSFRACLANLLPFLVYGVLLFVIAIVAALPFGLGFIVLVPVAAGSVYAAYVDIFERA